MYPVRDARRLRRPDAARHGERHLRADRPGDADRAGGEERHSYRRVRQTGIRARQATGGIGHRGRATAAAADPHDLVRLHPGLHAAGDRNRRRRVRATRAGHGGGIRHERRDAGRDLSHPGVLRTDAERVGTTARPQGARRVSATTLAVAIACACGLLLAGCKLGPDYRRPDTKAPANYRFASDADAASLADEGWWQVYQDPRLQQLIREALVHNLDVGIAAARVDQARAILGATRLQQLPAVSVSAGAERARTSNFELLPGEPAISNIFQLDGSLSYEVDFWGKYRRATEAARAQLLQSDFAKQDVIAGLVAGVATAYFTLQALDEQLDITNRTIGTRQKFVDLTSAQHDRGTVSELDVATAEGQLAIAKANLPELQRQIGLTEDQLSVLLGHNPDQVR